MIITLQISNYSNASGTYKGFNVQFKCDEDAKLSKGDIAVHTVFGLCYIYEDIHNDLLFKSPHVNSGCITSHVSRNISKMKKVIETSEDYFNLPVIKIEEEKEKEKCELIGRVIQGPNFTNGVRIFKVNEYNVHCRYEDGTNDKQVVVIPKDKIVLISKDLEAFELTRNSLQPNVMNTTSRSIGKKFSMSSDDNAEVFTIKSLMLKEDDTLIFYTECGKECEAPIYTKWYSDGK